MTSSSEVLLGLDPGSQRMGWCVGDGTKIPDAGAWRFDQAGDDLGLMLRQLHNCLVPLIRERGVTAVCYEKPILMRHDTLGRLRKTLNLGGHIEYVCDALAIPCSEVTAQDVKRELGGKAFAGKDAMVAAAQQLGVALPVAKADGREDAADALGVWLLLLRNRSRDLSWQFDQALWGRREIA
jgi:Holliday junction resolvasome RuvABC endonuclease subunit